MLAVFGAILGLTFDALIGDPQQAWTGNVIRLSAAFGLMTGGIVLALTLERLRWVWSIGFASAAGLVVGAVYYWNGSPEGWHASEEWQLVAAFLAVAIAVPLFQSARDSGRFRTDYAPIHSHAWNNALLWGAAWAFVLTVYLLSHLLAELFALIGIDLLRRALDESWFTMALVGAALGAGFGLLRERDTMLGAVQRVATTVLSVLTPVLALGLALFVLALPFTGLAPLWEQTKSTTPILLTCVIGAFILINITLGRSAEEESGQPILRYSAMALGWVMLPLAGSAAFSTWLRIDQYGLTPARLWGLVFVAACLAIAIAYFLSLLRGFARWSDRARSANVVLALGICASALVLSTPLIDFGAISARDQLSRLKSGKVTADAFDWAALRFDFGPAGTRALAELEREGAPAIRTLATKALASKARETLAQDTSVARRSRALARSIRVLPRAVPVPETLRLSLAQDSICASGDCTLIWNKGEREAVAIGFACPNCLASASWLTLGSDDRWQVKAADSGPEGLEDRRAASAAQRRALAAGQIEVRQVTRRALFLDGRPLAEPF